MCASFILTILALLTIFKITKYFKVYLFDCF